MLLLKQKDVYYLDKLQRDYENTILYYNELSGFMREWEESIKTNKNFLISLESDINNVEAQRVNKATKDYVRHIMDYFERDYGLSCISSYIQDKIIKKYIKYDFTKYNHEGFHYQNIIKDICVECKITDLDEATINNLRNRIIDKTKFYFSNNRISETNDKIKITDYFFQVDSSCWGDECCINDNTIKLFKDLFTACKYISIGKLELDEELNLFIEKVGNWTKRLSCDEFYTTHNIDVRTGIRSIRFYKNRSMEIKFTNEESRYRFIKVLRGEF